MRGKNRVPGNRKVIRRAIKGDAPSKNASYLAKETRQKSDLETYNVYRKLSVETRYWKVDLDAKAKTPMLSALMRRHAMDADSRQRMEK